MENDMNNELKEIEDLKARIENYKGIKACSDRSISALLGEIATIEAQIAEEKKPKLKHGRCGITSTGKPYITIGNGEYAVVYHEDGSSSPAGAYQNGNSITSTGAFASFEAFDEIKAMQKNLDQAEFVHTHPQPSTILLSQVKDGRIQITVKFGDRELTGYNDKDERDAFCLETRQIVATMKREEAKK
jgi:hypothetical protein